MLSFKVPSTSVATTLIIFALLRSPTRYTATLLVLWMEAAQPNRKRQKTTPMRRVGLIGYGSIGKSVAESILAGKAGRSSLAAVLVR